MERVLTGIGGLDNAIEGGVMKGRSFVLRGPSGSGKTTMGLMFLIEGARQGERCAYLTLEQSPQEIIHDNLRLLPDLEKYCKEEKITIFDRSIKTDIISKPDSKTWFEDEPQKNKKDKTDAEDPTHFKKFIDNMFQMLGEQKFSRLVLDSINALGRKNRLMMKAMNQAYNDDDHYELVLNLVERAKELGITCFLLSEGTGDDQEIETHESFIGDGVFELHVNEALDTRTLKIKKIRATNHTLRPLTFKFKEKEGIVIEHVSKGGL